MVACKTNFYMIPARDWALTAVCVLIASLFLAAVFVEIRVGEARNGAIFLGICGSLLFLKLSNDVLAEAPKVPTGAIVWIDTDKKH